jgi:hypothetical protein
VIVPDVETLDIGTISNCRAEFSAEHANDTGFTDARLRQAEHERIELRVRQRQRGARVLGPHELALVESARGEPHADAVVHENLHAIGPTVGEQVRMVRVRCAEDAHDSGQRGFGAGSHVQWLDSEPHSVDADH